MHGFAFDLLYQCSSIHHESNRLAHGTVSGVMLPQITHDTSEYIASII